MTHDQIQSTIAGKISLARSAGLTRTPWRRLLSWQERAARPGAGHG